MMTPNDSRMCWPAPERNKEPILEVLKKHLPSEGTVLELASGSGQHAAFFASKLPHLQWQPSDMDAENMPSIEAWVQHAQLPNLPRPVWVDATDETWPLVSANAIVCINMIHISPWAATEGLMKGASRILSQGGILYTYGPYMIDGEHTAPSNESFDRSLRSRNSAWGVRDAGVVAELAHSHGLIFQERVAMPANNFSLVFKKA